MYKPTAIYARVSSDRQKENHTIASQTAVLIEYAQKNGYSVPPEWVFQDEGYSGAILVRPGLEALRDLAAEGPLHQLGRAAHILPPSFAGFQPGSRFLSSPWAPRSLPSRSEKLHSPRRTGRPVVPAFSAAFHP